MTVNKDKDYVERLKNDDFSAFDALFKKYAESLYGFALSITKEPYIAEEIAQLVFMKIWEKRAQLDEFRSIKSFLFSIAYSETISWLRKEKSEKQRMNVVGAEMKQASNETNYSIEFNEINAIANQIIEGLPEKRKEIFKLSRVQGYSNKEIAIRLNISIKTVENQMTAALKTLKEQLSKNGILGLLFYFITLY
ncbi:RNA polymerase sigma factor [Sunxiuqinia sp. sy24]|uniref:RNA polymerase sigma factor n=1 Tax=Sunxiuqinia sp. sy24 TaxID=3461495 RepID=UPI0040454128